MKLLSQCDKKMLQGAVVLLRTDFNVPIEGGKVVDDFRIQQTLPTIAFLRDAGAKVRIITHVGRDPHETTRPIAAHLQKLLNGARVVHSTLALDMRDDDSEIVLYENVRQDSREKENDTHYAAELSALGDIFVQDAFAVCHRSHASIVGIPQYMPSYAGLLLEAEIAHLTAARTPVHPSLAVLGGAKFETKEPLIREFLSEHTYVFVGGALANELLLARGLPVGTSRVEDGKVPADILQNEKLIPITDVVVQNSKGVVRTCGVDAVMSDEKIVDIGRATALYVANIARTARSIVWNGPLGWYEEGFTEASLALARAIEESNEGMIGTCNAQVVIGGGDTVALLQNETKSACTFVSTGGGAMLDFLLHGTLPGIKALS